MHQSQPSILPHSIIAQNSVALFIFTIPLGATNEELFISPIFQSVRRNISKRCHCEISVFDGNSLAIRTHSTPDELAGRSSQEILLNFHDPKDTLLFTRGHWVIQVVYLTEPSSHFQFLKMIDNFAMKMKACKDRKGKGLKATVSTGFKYANVLTLTYQELKSVTQNEPQEPLGNTLRNRTNSDEQIKEDCIMLPREWGELPLVKTESSDKLRNLQGSGRLQHRGDLVKNESNQLKSSENPQCFFIKQNELNHNSSLNDCIETIRDEIYNSEEIVTCLQTLENELDSLAKKINSN